MEDRKRRYNDETDVRGKIAEGLKRVVGTASFFDGTHIFTPHADVPDDSALRLVVLLTKIWHSRDEARIAEEAVLDYVRNNGPKPRYRGNRLIFLVADHGALARLNDAARVVLAWGSIVGDIKQARLNIDLLQQRQAEKELQTAQEVLPRAIRECFKWLLCPGQENATDPKPHVEAFPLNTSGGSLVSEIERICLDNELVITTWSPIHLRAKLKELYWRPGEPTVRAMTFWEDTLRYLYLPRMKDREVLAKAIRNGAATRDFFGTAYSQNGDLFEGFHLGMGDVQLDDTLLLIELEAAKAFEEASRPKPKLDPEPEKLKEEHVPSGNPPVRHDERPLPDPQRAQAKSRSFHGAADIPPATAKMRMIQLAEEIVSLLMTDPNAQVKVTVEIAAEFPDGAGDQVKRAVSENARSLGLKIADWE
jgi:hypothetical protein